MKKSCDGDPWQTAWKCFSLNIKDKLLSAAQEPDIIHQRSPKKWTKEAVLMTSVILVFVGLAFLGTSITAYEFLFQDNKKKYSSSENGSDDDLINKRKRVSKETESTQSNDVFEATRSFLKCFCLVKSWKAIFNTTPTENLIVFFQGLRSLIILCIIGGHTLFIYTSITRNLNEMKSLLDSRATHIFLNGVIIVDILFLISGYLNAKSFFELYNKCNGNISWTNFFFKRIARLTPMYVVLLGFYSTLFSYTGSGVVWPTYNTNPVCQKDWWRHLLYINNFEESAKLCLPWCWYLATEVQFHFVSPLFMVSLIRWPRLGYALMLASISASGVINSVLTYQHNLIDSLSRIELYLDDPKPFIERFFDNFDIIYVKPYTRITPYLMAILVAYYLHKKDHRRSPIRNSAVTLCCGWSIAFFFLWFCLFFPFKTKEVLMASAFYNGVKGLFFSITAAWMGYLCLTGQAEGLKNFLSWKYFLPLSRLSYVMYLVHPIIMFRMVLQLQKVDDFNYVSLIWLNFYFYGASFVCALVASIFIASPILHLMHLWKKKRVMKKTNIHLN